MKKYIYIIIAVVVVLAVFLFFMQSLGGDNISYKPVNENENKIYIGVFEPLTGLNAEGGNQERIGIMYANAMTPTVSIDGVTYDLKLVYADNKSEPSQAKSAAESLLNENVSAVLGSYGSAVSLKGAPVFEAAGLPTIGISCSNPDITALYKYYYRVCFVDSLQGSAMAGFAYGRDLRHAAVVTQVGDAYSKGLGEYFTEEFTALGGTTEQFSFNTATMNFSSLIEKLMASSADFIYMPSPATSGIKFINQLRSAQCELPVYGGDTWDTPTLISTTGENSREVYFTSQFDEYGDMDTSGVDFVSKLSSWIRQSDDRLEINGGSSAVSPVSAFACDAYMTLVEAIKSANSADPAAINKALKTIEYKGITGTITFDDNGDCGKSTVYFKTVNAAKGKFDTLQMSAAS